jgi:hypothetical protein
VEALSGLKTCETAVDDSRLASVDCDQLRRAVVEAIDIP